MMLFYFSGQGCGFDIDLVKMVSDAVTIPVIASSGAGTVEHFSEVFEKTNASAALAAGIFHRKEVLSRLVLFIQHAMPGALHDNPLFLFLQVLENFDLAYVICICSAVLVCSI
jgi:tRNA-dihydrouridine synthase